MGSRDFRKHEKKKLKKVPPKVTTSVSVPLPTATVEVIKKKRAPKEEREEA
jgi:copper chaperone CopZ